MKPIRPNPNIVPAFFAAVIVGIVLIYAAFGEPAPPIGWTTSATVIRVIDGDTVEVEISRRLNVRLDSCWAPESRTRDAFEKTHGLAAKAHLAELCAGKRVILNIPASDEGSVSDVFTLSRVVGTLWTTDPHETYSINELMIRSGYAWPTKAEQIKAIDDKRHPGKGKP